MKRLAIDRSIGRLARRGVSHSEMMIFGLVFIVGVSLSSLATAAELPSLKAGVNDLAHMMPQASVEDLEARLARFHTETGNSVAVLTVRSLEGEKIENLARRGFQVLPLAGVDLEKTVLLVVARQEREVGFQAGAALRDLFPEPATSGKLYDHIALYFNGLRPDLGIHGAVHYLFRVLRGDVRVNSLTEEEKLEEVSLRGAGAGAIFAAFLGPVLALFVGGLWGIYSTQYGFQRGVRLSMGAIFGGATAKLVATVMSRFGGVSDGLWYFIMAVSIPLALFGSLTEFWMAGDWRGIPRKKERRGKPEDHMGI